ncbi:MAG: methyltransferase, partial [Candidatus Heimdallarchaeota archaeon]|nr:methyltransferase [Candidatus Heimdallarchaeota archaeon]
QLKKYLKKEYRLNDYQQQREYRKLYRQASQKILLEVVDHQLRVKKSPSIGWLKILYPNTYDFFISFPDIQGLNSSWQWYIKGLEIKTLNLKIHPYYDVYFPTRFSHLNLFSNWIKTYSGSKEHAIDIGVGSGVISFSLIQHGFLNVLGTDTNKNAIIGTDLDSKRLEFTDNLTLKLGDLFVEDVYNKHKKFDLIVFNPPWLKTERKLINGIDQAIYYEDGLFTRFFKDAKIYLKEKGKLVLLFSNFAEITGSNQKHPINEELKNNNRFIQENLFKQQASPASKKTRRKDWRKHENTELWVLNHT